ncbi:hypothetical protein [Clostridium sp. VAP52]|uniref:hypothetical protein n=1 Tax=Clostridium sp. VAP52 TaxID=2949977 RepID=UPI002079954A|nr:hypothetical protein [Clostridium sp. VAP52]
MKKTLIKLVYIILLGIVNGLILKHYNLQILSNFIGMMFMLMLIGGTETINNTIINKK